MKRKRTGAIKFHAAAGTMKILASGLIQLTLSATADQLTSIMALMGIKQDGDSLALSVTRVKAPKIKKTENAKKKQNNHKKQARRVRRYPYRD